MNFIILFSVFMVIMVEGRKITTPSYKIPSKWNKNYGPSDVVRDINAKRKAVGYPALRYSKDLSNQCEFHANVKSDYRYNYQ